MPVFTKDVPYAFQLSPQEVMCSRSHNSTANPNQRCHWLFFTQRCNRHEIITFISYPLSYTKSNVEAHRQSISRTHNRAIISMLPPSCLKGLQTFPPSLNAGLMGGKGKTLEVTHAVLKRVPFW
uniref:Uncharacterized protein n=1 Tax=Sphaerodactylus townsendi TaxID=933632 RepID=A0ACB8ELC5_9SAUR